MVKGKDDCSKLKALCHSHHSAHCHCDGPGLAVPHRRRLVGLNIFKAALLQNGRKPNKNTTTDSNPSSKAEMVTQNLVPYLNKLEHALGQAQH